MLLDILSSTSIFFDWLQDVELPSFAPSTSSAPVLRKQFSVKPPPMESIVEEHDMPLDLSEDDSLHIEVVIWCFQYSMYSRQLFS